MSDSLAVAETQWQFQLSGLIMLCNEHYEMDSSEFRITVPIQRGKLQGKLAQWLRYHVKRVFSVQV